MAITIVGTRQVGALNNGAAVTLTFDGTPAEGDLVVVVGGNSDPGSTGAAGPTTAGYTEQARRNVNLEPLNIGVWTKFLGASPDASVVSASVGGQDSCAYASVVLRGVDQSTLLDAAIVGAGPTTTATPDPGSIDTVSDDAWVLATTMFNDPIAASGFPSGYANTGSAAGNDTRDLGVAIATLEKLSAGTEDPGTFTIAASVLTFSYTVAIRPSAPTGDPANLVASVVGDDVTLTWDA